MPEGGFAHEAMHRAADPFATFRPPAPAASAPWEETPPGRAVPPGPSAGGGAAQSAGALRTADGIPG